MTSDRLAARETARDIYSREVSAMAERLRRVRLEFIELGASWFVVGEIERQADRLEHLAQEMALADVTLGIEDELTP